MILVDSSAWIELLRGRSHPVGSTLEGLIAEGADLAVTEPVLMEVLAGAPTPEALARAREQLVALPILQIEGLADFEQAADIYRMCRAAGETVRSQIDCLIAVPAIRHGATLLHNDRDFEVIARHTKLKLHGPLS